MTNKEIREAVTRGTTTRPHEVRVICRSRTACIVLWPGGHVGSHHFRQWSPSWLAKYAMANVANGFGRERGADVEKPQRLTAGAIAKLAAAHGMKPTGE